MSRPLPHPFLLLKISLRHSTRNSPCTVVQWPPHQAFLSLQAFVQPKVSFCRVSSQGTNALTCPKCKRTGRTLKDLSIFRFPQTLVLRTLPSTCYLLPEYPGRIVPERGWWANQRWAKENRWWHWTTHLFFDFFFVVLSTWAGKSFSLILSVVGGKCFCFSILCRFCFFHVFFWVLSVATWNLTKPAVIQPGKFEVTPPNLSSPSPVFSIFRNFIIFVKIDNSKPSLSDFHQSPIFNLPSPDDDDDVANACKEVMIYLFSTYYITFF